MSQNGRMPLELQFSCPLPNGLHARPASQMANLANSFVSSCALINARNGSSANIKSVLSIIAADVRFNDACSIQVNGADQKVALSALERFIGHELPHCDAPLLEMAGKEPSHNIPRALRSSGVEILLGFAVCRGIAEGAVVLVGNPAEPQEFNDAPGAGAEQEQHRVASAIVAVQSRIQKMLASRTSSTEA